MARPSKGLGDHRYVNKEQPDWTLPYSALFPSWGQPPCPPDPWEPVSLKGSHCNHFCGFNT